MTAQSPTPLKLGLKPQDTNTTVTQQLIDHVWQHHQYAMTQCDAEDLLYTDMFGSIEDFIAYMSQDGVGNLPLSHTRKLYTTAELDAMGAQKGEKHGDDDLNDNVDGRQSRVVVKASVPRGQDVVFIPERIASPSVT